MQTLWIPYDQLSLDQAYLKAPAASPVVLLVESRAFFDAIPHHKVKIAFYLSAMRHFAKALTAAGWTVDYHSISETDRMESALRKHVERFCPNEVIVPEPNDWEIARSLPVFSKKFAIPFRTVPYAHFIVPRQEFAAWANGKKSLRMELHYRRVRQKHGWLMDEKGKPVGGEWNFDSKNRLGHRDWVKNGSPRGEEQPCAREDAISQATIQEVNRLFPAHPGDAKSLWLPVTREESLEWLERFVKQRLGNFGPYEDMMSEGEPILFHSVLSPMLNLGLLTPKECVEAALSSYQKGQAPLESVEGFVRQIMGWREFVNGVYWLQMPDYVDCNALEATRPLPDWAWTGETEMHCVRQTMAQVLELGYNHHIQRLMVLGNYFLLAGVEPGEVLKWFTAMYVDAHGWVMAANVMGMVLFADGGFMSSKPYAAGSGYISRMSNYCKGCRFKPDQKEGPNACPFHSLYWNFIGQHEGMLQANPRTKMVVNLWSKKSITEKKQLQDRAEAWLANTHPKG